MPNKSTIKALTTILVLSVVTIISAPASFAGTATYVYDELDRLKEVHFDATNWIEYSYDEIGNLLAKIPHGNVATITATSLGNGAIYPSGSVIMFKGIDKTFTITPGPGCHVIDIKINGTSLSDPNISNYTFTNVTADNTIQANFSINTYTISTAIGSPGYGGTISPSSATVSYNDNQSFTITPDAGFSIIDVKTEDGVSLGPVTGYTFTTVTANHTLTASFAMGCASPAKNSRTGTTYATIQAAYNDNALLDGDTILATANLFVENFTAGKNVSVTIDGGYTCDFSSNPYRTPFKGAPRISSGTVKLKNVQVIY